MLTFVKLQDSAPALRTVLAFLAMGVWAGFLATLWFQQTDGSAPISWGVLGLSWLVAATIALAVMKAPATFLNRAISVAAVHKTGPVLVIVIGFSLRLTIALIMAPQATSDGASYVALAQQMASTGTYGTEGARAFWPPGLPLLLTPLLWLGVPSQIAALIVGMVSYVIAAIGIYKLGKQLGLQSWAALPLWMLTLWPSHILCTGLPEKELLVIALMPWILERTIHALRGSLLAACVAGILTGLAVLVQPSFQFLPIAGTLTALLLARSRSSVLVGGALATLAMLLVISPWTYRNYQVFGATVLVSTNGGDVLNRANNDKATGAYTPKASIEVHGLNELAADKESKRLAINWIRDNPARFLQLSMGKALLFLGDDSYGAYAALRKGNPNTSRHLYLAAKLVSATPWLLVWLLILACLAKPLSDPHEINIPVVGMLVTPLLYLLAVHSVFESGPKYHLPTLPIVLVLCAYLLRRASTSNLVFDVRTSNFKNEPVREHQ
jgi:hypothetical protein